MATRPARENPFRVSRVERLRYRLDDPGWQGLLQRFERLGRRGALVGPKGSGKTTLLEEMEERLEADGWRIVRVRLREDRRHLSSEERRYVTSCDSNSLITVDGVEQLTWWRWRHLELRSGRAGGLVVTSHIPGRLPTLHRHETSGPLLLDLVSDLVSRDDALSLRPELERLFEAHEGNLRDCLRSLYDRWALAEIALLARPG